MKNRDVNLTAEDAKLIVRALNTHVWAERESCLKLARDNFKVVGGEAPFKSWPELFAWAKTLPSLPPGIHGAEKLRDEADKLIAKIEAAPKPQKGSKKR